jgi:O-antigen ligase
MRTWLTDRLHDFAASPRALLIPGLVGLLGLSAVVAVVTAEKGALWAVALVPALALGGVIVLWPAAGVLFLLTTLIFKYPDAIASLPLGPNRILGGVMLLLLLGAIALRRRLDFFRTPTYAVFIVVFGLLALNALLVGSVEPPAHLTALDLTDRSVDRAIFQLSFLTFFGAFIRTRRHLLLVVGIFVVALVVTIPGAVTHSYDLSAQVSTSLERGRAVATSGIQSAENANRLAFVCSMGIALVWFAMVHYRSLLLRALGGVVLPALVLTIFLSGSRSGLINLALLAILAPLQSGIRIHRLAVVALFAVITLGFVYAVVPEQQLQRITTFLPAEEAKGATASVNLRALMVAEGLKLAAANPFVGVGVGNIRWMTALDPDTGGQGLTMHNAYLLALAEGGIVLLAAYALLFGATLRSLNRTAARAAAAPEVGLGWLAKATRTNLVLLLVFSLFADAWHEFPFLLILGTAIVLAAVYRQPLAARAAGGVRRWVPSPSST